MGDQFQRGVDHIMPGGHGRHPADINW